MCCFKNTEADFGTTPSFMRGSPPHLSWLSTSTDTERGGRGEGDAANVKTTASRVPQIQDVGFQRIRNRKNDIQFERERPKGRGTRNSAKQIEVVVFHPPTRFGVYAIPKRRKSTNNLWPVAPLTLLKSWSETWARPKNTKGRGDPASAFPPRTWPFRLSGFYVEANYRDSSVLSCNFREYCSAT